MFFEVLNALLLKKFFQAVLYFKEDSHVGALANLDASNCNKVRQ